MNTANESGRVPTRLVGAAPFFSLTATYTIAEGATAGELLNDAGCLMAGAIEALELALAEDTGDTRRSDAAIYGALYLFMQAKAALDMGHKLASADYQKATEGAS